MALFIILGLGLISGLTSICVCRAASWADDIKKPDIFSAN